MSKLKLPAELTITAILCVVMLSSQILTGWPGFIVRCAAGAAVLQIVGILWKRAHKAEVELQEGLERASRSFFERSTQR